MSDRDLIKKQEEGVYKTAAGMSDVVTAVAALHSRVFPLRHQGSENAATNVAEAGGVVVPRAGRISSVKLVSQDSIPNDASNYAKLYVYAYNSSAGDKTLVASWNTATAAQSAITAFQNHECSLGSDLSLAAGSVLTYHVGKTGTGQALNDFTVTVDVEEV